jgi:hypothetical protein
MKYIFEVNYTPKSVLDTVNIVNNFMESFGFSEKLKVTAKLATLTLISNIKLNEEALKLYKKLSEESFKEKIGGNFNVNLTEIIEE